MEDVLQRMVRVEAKLDLLIQICSAANGMPNIGGSKSGNLERFTTKQHAALQMLFAGKSNSDIAERFEVSENTAKVYIRSIAAKLGVNTRNQIIVALYDEYKSIGSEEYKLISGGLPKNWDSEYTTPDPFRFLYAIKMR